MKKLWRTLPNFARWLLVTVVIMAMTGSGVLAYNALFGKITGTIEEPLGWVGDSSYDFGTIYPTETVLCPLTVSNQAPNPIEFDVLYTISPADLDAEITVTIPSKLTAPATGQIAFDIEITASKSAPPIAELTIDYIIDR